MSDEDTHHSSLLRGVGLRTEEVEEKYDPYWNIEVCPQCGGGGNVPSGVEYMGQHEMVCCDECYGIGYTNERIQEILYGIGYTNERIQEILDELFNLM